MKKRFEAVVESGMGKGAFFLSKKHYAEEFEKILGRKAFPGTLNARVSPPDAKKILELKENFGGRIGGFEEGGKKFGGLAYLNAKISGFGCLLVFPDKSTHSASVLEIVCAENLRQKLLLKDGDKIIVEVVWGKSVD